MGYWNSYEHPNYREVKRRIGEAFRYMRKHNKLICRQNFMCCQGCGSAELGSRMQEENKKKPGRWNGVAFFHRQSEESLKQHGDVCIYYFHSTDCSDPSGAIVDENRPKDATQVGQCIKEACEAHGLDVEWNGSSMQAVTVRLPQAEEEAT
jgi:hypothetical protein